MKELLLLLVLGCGASLGSKWSYVGHSGPQHWHSLFPEGCAGRAQSPIDIRPEQTLYSPDLKDFAIWYDPPKPDSNMTLHNNGHALQVDLDGDFYLSNGGLKHVYRAAQFHFHWGHKVEQGSEHTVEGRASPIEMHLVTYNQDRFSSLGEAATQPGGLAVLGVMFEVSKHDNPAFKDIVRSIKHVRNPDQKNRIRLPLVSLRSLLPADIARYFRYSGSLTTPGCFESVTWTIFQGKQTLSRGQLKEFRKLLQPRKHHGDRHRRASRRASRSSDVTDGEAAALAELGVLGDVWAEDRLRGELLMDKMYGDMPAGSNSDAVVHATVHDKSHTDTELPHKEMEPHASAPAHPSVPSTPLDEHTDSHMLKEEKPAGPPSPPPQAPLVNNFRPVQPLHGRLVYRSFKLAPSVVQVDRSAASVGPQPSYDVRRHENNHHRHNGGAVLRGAGGFAMLAALLVICW